MSYNVLFNRVRRARSPLVVLGAGVWTALVAAPRSAHADDRVSVTWSAPKECPAASEVTKRTEARVPTDASVRASARVEKISGRYRATLEIEAAPSGSAKRDRGERVLTDASCDALASNVAVVIAMSVAPSSDVPREDEAKPAEPATAAPTPSATVSPPLSPPAPEKPSDEKPRSDGNDRLSPTLRLEVVADAGLLPSLAGGGGLAIGIDALDRLHVELHGAIFLAQDGNFDAARGARFSLVSGGLRGCWTLTRPIEVAPCLGAGVLRLSATGFGTKSVTDGDAFTWAPEAAVLLRAPIAGPLALRGGIAAIAPMSRQSFVITARGTVHEPSAVAVRSLLGPEVRF